MTEKKGLIEANGTGGCLLALWLLIGSFGGIVFLLVSTIEWIAE